MEVGCLTDDAWEITVSTELKRKMARPWQTSVLKDYHHALMDGPWFVGDQYLHVQAWEANFHPNVAEVTHTVVLQNKGDDSVTLAGFNRSEVALYEIEHIEGSIWQPRRTNSPRLPPHSSIHMQSPPPNDQALVMENLEQIWSRLYLENSNKENVSYVRIPVHPRVAMSWNQMTQTPNLPLRLEQPPQNQTRRMTLGHVQVWHSVHPYQAPVGHPVAQPVWQWNAQESSTSVESPERLPEAIFHFLDLSEINIALREEVPKLYIVPVTH
ncbi:hypothetical protein CFP56_023104 [Quercus suber]|uniref:Uncharacterized protein n=1 Tax=Quercus suber TaxID=58331 RepID=A0AAW0LZX9_QUESU